jgi:hypothetical protein
LWKTSAARRSLGCARVRYAPSTLEEGQPPRGSLVPRRRGAVWYTEPRKSFRDVHAAVRPLAGPGGRVAGDMRKRSCCCRACSTVA